MKNFDIERKGYNKKQVDSFVESFKKQYEDIIEMKQQEIMQAQAELMQYKMELETYHSKDDQISNALVVAVETAKEIESSAKTIYELEIKRVRVLYKKWKNILNEIKALYPELNDGKGVSILFKEFEDALSKILSKEAEIANEPSTVNKTAEKIYAKTLLSRMWGYNQKSPAEAVKENQKIKRKDSRAKNIEQSVNNDSEGDFETFLKSEFDDFDNFQYKKSHKDADVPVNQKSNYLNVLEQNLSKNQESSEFDMLEALKPKEDLMEIMKNFNLDD